MREIKSDNQRRAPSKSVYESGGLKSIGLTAKVKKIQIAKQKSQMINSEHTYQSV